jgi:hypothetical protein
MAEDPVALFFTALGEQRRVAAFEGDRGTVRFDVLDRDPPERWHVTVAGGKVTVTRHSEPADAVLRLSRPALEALVTGRLNAQAAVLRGLIDCEGPWAVLIMFQRCLPGPPGSTGRAAPISGETVMGWHRP